MEKSPIEVIIASEQALLYASGKSFNASDHADVISSPRSEVRQTLATVDQTHHELSHSDNKLSKTQHTNLTESNKSRTSSFKGTVRENRGTRSQANWMFLTGRFYKHCSFMEYYIP
jgi:transglutaminase/protease-like cytokinesis protein 3